MIYRWAILLLVFSWAPLARAADAPPKQCYGWFARLSGAPRPYNARYWNKFHPTPEFATDGHVLAKFPDQEGREVTLIGTISSHELFPGYRVVVLKDGKGNLHYLDANNTDFFTPWSVLAPRKIIAESETLAQKTRVFLDDAKVKNFICAKRARIRKDPEMRRALKVIEKNVHGAMVPIATRLKYLLPVCTTALALPFAGGYYTAVKREENEDNLISNHQSNFTEGLMMMGLAHSCIGMGSGFSNAALALALGVTTLGNIHAEIGLGQEKSKGLFAQPVSGNRDGTLGPKPGEKVKTDLGDFTAGMSAVVGYFALVKAIERSYGFQLSKLCD